MEIDPDQWESEYGHAYPDTRHAIIRLCVRLGFEPTVIRDVENAMDLLPMIEGTLMRLKDLARHGTCGNCRFFNKFSLDEGLCWRFPPRFVGGNDKERMSEAWLQPATHEDDYCGEFQPAPGEPIAD